jgi:hypothetical protein
MTIKYNEQKKCKKLFEFDDGFLELRTKIKIYESDINGTRTIQPIDDDSTTTGRTDKDPNRTKQ